METPVKSVCWKRVSAMKKKGGVNNVRPQKLYLRFVIYNSTYELKKKWHLRKKIGKKGIVDFWKKCFHEIEISLD